MGHRQGLFFLGLAACAEPVSQSGQVIDGLTGAPVGDFKLIARAASTDDMRCQAREAIVGPDGQFDLADLCPEETYALRPETDDAWWFADVTAIPPGGSEAITIAAWPSPKGTGLYQRIDGKLAPVKTSDDVRTEVLVDEGREIRYPARKGSPATTLAATDHLLLVGAEVQDEMQILPMVPSGPRSFDVTGRVVKLEAHEYIGIRFDAEDQVFDVETVFDPDKVIDKQRGDRAVRYIPGDAVSPGRYAALRPGDGRVSILQFGPVAEAPPVDEDAPPADDAP